MSFDWRTEEEDGWQDAEAAGKTAVRRENFIARWRSYWWLGLLGLLGMVAIGWLVQGQIERRLMAATSNVEEELLATSNFILQTAVSRDETLFSTALSGRNPDWVTTQKRLLHDGLLLDRPMFGWQHVAQPALLLEDVSVQLAPDLRSAELLYPQAYAVLTSPGVTETVTLQQTAVYRQGKTHWLYAPPTEAFWGKWVTNSGKHLTLVYPARDAEVAERLAADLDALVGQMCAELADLNCPDDLQLHLRLDSDPDALLTANEVKTLLAGSLRLNLPAPTLLGKPIDEAGYDLLYQAYGVWLATAVLTHQTAYDCCLHQLFFRALRDYQLAELGLQPWPMDEDAYSQVLSSGFDGSLQRQWMRRWEFAPPLALQMSQAEAAAPAWQQVYLMVEYLAAEETAVSPTEMMRRINQSDMLDWLAEIDYNSSTEDLFTTQVINYAYAQSLANEQTEPPLPLPKGTITAVCRNTTGQNENIYQYNLATGAWHALNYAFSDAPGYISVSSVDGRRFLITKNNFTSGELTIKVALLTEDGETLLEETQVTLEPERQNFWVNYFFVGQTGEYFVRAVYENDEQRVTMRATDCPTDDCPERPLPGWPSFSPDNSYFIEVPFTPFPVEDNDEESHQSLMVDLSLTSVDTETSINVGQGYAPSWLNETTFIYWRWQDNKMELVTAVLPQLEPRVLLNAATLLALIPPQQRPDELFPSHSLSMNPQNSQELLLSMPSAPSFDSEEPNFHFKLTLAADFASLDKIELLEADASANGLIYSPDGRYITLVEYDWPESTWTLLDQTTGELSDPITSVAFSFPWSSDGEWFVQSNQNYLLLHAPAYDYQHLVPHSFGACRQVIWEEE